MRKSLNVEVGAPLKPLELLDQLPGLTVLRRRDLMSLVTAGPLAEAFGRSRSRWSAATFAVNGMHVVVLNDTHAVTRQNATIMEELFHIRLKHEPERLYQCAQTGLIRRQFSRAKEDEAYWSAAAALVPYAPLREMLESGRPRDEIAHHFEVSEDLVAFRMKVTKLWRRYQ